MLASRYSSQSMAVAESDSHSASLFFFVSRSLYLSRLTPTFTFTSIALTLCLVRTRGQMKHAATLWHDSHLACWPPTKSHSAKKSRFSNDNAFFPLWRLELLLLAL